MLSSVLFSLSVCSLSVDWDQFLSRYSLQWKWKDRNATRLLLQDSTISNCGGTGCCITAVNKTLMMEACTSDENQLWLLDEERMMSAKDHLCVNNVRNQTVLGECETPMSYHYGTLYVLSSSQVADSPPASCLTIQTSQPFCDESICPFKSLSNISSGSPVIYSPCNNGNKAQLFNVEQLLPNDWTTSPYIGNGEVGVRLQYPDVTGSQTSKFELVMDNAFFGALGKRYPAGFFTIDLGEGVQTHGELNHNITVTISNGLMKGSIAAGDVELAAFTGYVHATEGVLVFDLMAKTEGVDPVISWVSKNGTQSSNIDFVTVKSPASTTMTLIATLSQSQSLSSERISSAMSSLKNSPQQFFTNHTRWWIEYWNSSFIAIPDPLLEEDYYTQLYRFASSDRVSLHGLDGDFGPTNEFNLWPDTVWDMNEQVMYWITEGSNKPQLVLPLLKDFIEGKVNKGGLWMLDKIDKHINGYGTELSPQLKTSQDKLFAQLLSEIQQQLAATVGTNKTERDTGHLKVDNDGIYHLTGCSSPEYRCYPPFESLACDIKTDCNYGLSQIRWGIQRAMEIAEMLNVKLEAASYWNRLLVSQLAAYPMSSERGFKLSAECDFLCPHRHFSHLLMMYDLELVDQNDNAIAEKSLDNWYGLTCNSSNIFNEECRGFTQCGMAMMSSRLARKDAAVGNVTSIIKNNLSPNGMYGECVYANNPSMFSPVSESGYCTAAVTNTLLFHVNRDDGILQCFYSVPDNWSDAQFYQLRTHSGHLVSSKMTNHTIQFVTISTSKQTSTTSVLVRVPWESPSVSPTPIDFRSTGNSVWNITMQPHIDYVIKESGTSPNMTFAPLPGQGSHYFGYVRPHTPIH